MTKSESWRIEVIILAQISELAVQGFSDSPTPGLSDQG